MIYKKDGSVQGYNILTESWEADANLSTSEKLTKEECFDGYWRKFSDLCRPNEPGC